MEKQHETEGQGKVPRGPLASLSMLRLSCAFHIQDVNEDPVPECQYALHITNYAQDYLNLQVDISKCAVQTETQKLQI